MTPHYILEQLEEVQQRLIDAQEASERSAQQEMAEGRLDRQYRHAHQFGYLTADIFSIQLQLQHAITQLKIMGGKKTAGG